MLFRGFAKQQSGGAIVSSLGTMYVGDEEPPPTTAVARITFNGDGTITYTGNGSSGATAWYTPTTTDIGNTYYIKATKTFGTNWTGTMATTAAAISSTGKYMQWSTTGTVSATVNVYIYSDSAGTNQVSSGTVEVYVTGTGM